MKRWVWYMVLGFLLPMSVAEARYPCEADLLEVLFAPEARVRQRQGRLVDLVGSHLDGLAEVLEPLGPVRWQRMAPPLDEAELDRMQARASAAWGHQVYNLNNLYYLQVPQGEDVWALSRKLRSLPEVANAYPVPLPQPLPTPDHEPHQEYLFDPAQWPPTGVAAYHAWTKPGGDGAGVTVCDLEYAWNLNHVDISKAAGCNWNPYPTSDSQSDIDHGTAVIGELVADDNGWGVTGICPGATLRTFGTYYDPTPPHNNPSWRLPEAIALVAAKMKAGDVILLEQQWEYSPSGQRLFIPAEWWGSTSPAAQSLNGVYAAIQNAVGAGIHVVEAAGNGGYDMDNLSWYGDSGAIVVGAGGAYPGGSPPPHADDLERMASSSYGWRVNVQGWGENIYTTGYDTLTGSTGPNDTYCYDFGGTSGASPMVAAAAACCVGYWTTGHGQTAASLPPLDLRSLLINTGTPQVEAFPGNVGHIGPRPNLVEAFRILDFWAPSYILSAEFWMPSHQFQFESSCELRLTLTNPGPPVTNVPVVVVLQVGGSFWFWPGWTPTFQTQQRTVPTGSDMIQVIPAFNWPAGTGTGSGLWFHGAMLTQGQSSILGIYDSWEFGYSS